MAGWEQWLKLESSSKVLIQNTSLLTACISTPCCTHRGIPSTCLEAEAERGDLPIPKADSRICGKNAEPVALSQLMAARSRSPGPQLGGCWQPEESVRHVGNGLVWETRLEHTPEHLVPWRETQEGNTDFKGPLYCPTSKKEPNYNWEFGHQGQWSSWKPSSVCFMLKVPWSSCCPQCQAYFLAKFKLVHMKSAIKILLTSVRPEFDCNPRPENISQSR